MIKTIKYLKWLKKSFLFTCDPFDNIQKALVFFLCTPILDMQVNQLKHFIYELIFYFPRRLPKDEVKLLLSNLIWLKK